MVAASDAVKRLASPRCGHGAAAAHFDRAHPDAPRLDSSTTERWENACGARDARRRRAMGAEASQYQRYVAHANALSMLACRASHESCAVGHRVLPSVSPLPGAGDELDLPSFCLFRSMVVFELQAQMEPASQNLYDILDEDPARAVPH